MHKMLIGPIGIEIAMPNTIPFKNNVIIEFISLRKKDGCHMTLILRILAWNATYSMFQGKPTGSSFYVMMTLF